jgi:hypothetical protein
MLEGTFHSFHLTAYTFASAGSASKVSHFGSVKKKSSEVTVGLCNNR